MVAQRLAHTLEELLLRCIMRKDPIEGGGFVRRTVKHELLAGAHFQRCRLVTVHAYEHLDALVLVGLLHLR